MPEAICPPREAGACIHRTPASWHRRLMSSLAEEGLSGHASTTTTSCPSSSSGLTNASTDSSADLIGITMAKAGGACSDDTLRMVDTQLTESQFDPSQT